MAYRTGIALSYAVRNGAAGCDAAGCGGAARNAGPATKAVDCVATCVGAAGTRMETAYAVTTSPVRHGTEELKASTAKPARRMKTTAAKTASRPPWKPPPMPPMEAAANASMETAAPMKTAPATSRLG